MMPIARPEQRRENGFGSYRKLE